MAVNSTMFGGVRLTDEDAKSFKRQLQHGKPKKAAKDNLRHGKKLAAEFVKRGYVVLK